MRYAVGQPVPRSEDPRLLTGNGRYTDDVNLPHQAYAVFVRSPHAHAEIKSIDASTAKAMPGIVDVLTGAEHEADGMGEITGPTPRKRRDGSVMFRPPRPALTSDRVRHIGQAVAMVIADSPARARDAAETVAVDYHPLPAVLGTLEANRDGMPAIWDGAPDNESFFFEMGDGDAAASAIEGAAHVIKQKFVINRVTANTMEPRGAVGVYTPFEDRYTMYAGCQRPFAWRTNLSKNYFRVQENQLSFVTGDLGGSFGMRGSIYPEIPLCAWASKRVGRPVKWTAERSEGFMADDHARDNVSEAELALDKDGKFLALRVRTNANLGAYVSFLGMGPPTGNIGGLAGVYTTPAIHVQVAGVFTNTSPLSPYRGAGRPEAAYIIERMIDLAAAETGIDPIELRRRNFIPVDAFPYKTPLTFTFDCGEFEAVMDEALELGDRAGFEARREASKAEGKLRGLGISCTIEQAAAPQSETAELRFDPSGTVTVLCGTTPHGQGHETIYKQLVCDRLGIEPGDIRVIEGDTDKVSFGTGTGGSRSATIGTSAVLAAVDKVIGKCHRIAAHMLEAADADVTYENAAFAVAGTDKSLPFIDVAKAAFQKANLPDGMESGLYEIATYDPEKANFPNGCHLSEVEIDPDTGEIEIVKYTVVHDVGFELNPLLVNGQVMGGIAQGAGQALMEDMVYDEGGQMLSGSFLDYTMPRAGDFPAYEIKGHPVPTAGNPLGVKGAGECGTVGALASVSNAVADALSPLGIRHLDMPATAPRVWKAIDEAGGT
ncbi:MAG: xanthine dehydrogenase family protein molybdopterin-binding subunit [Rhodospirillales bacterium]|nr:xanthine dehydrogenase family protein molybdopterin-binding subunit [Rhodospirillales bacterium]